MCLCGETLEPGFLACPSCGISTSSQVSTCPTCSREIKLRWKVCPHCEAVLSGLSTPTHGLEEPDSTETPAKGAGSSTPSDVGIYVSCMPDPGAAEGATNRVNLPIREGDSLTDRYTVRKMLGAGGFGAVYLVDDSVLAEQRALKVVAVGGGTADNARDQLLHEFKLRERISDFKHIVRSEDPRLCAYKGLSLVLLPMELANGGSLRNRLSKDGSLTERRKDSLRLFAETCQGVKAIHDAGLAHLDIKPENILLVNGTAKVTDFGIGRHVDGQFARNLEQILHEGVGTPQYMSPEQFRATRQKDIGPTSDIYSLGLVLYEILDGSLPFDGRPRELRDKHLEMQPKALDGDAGKWWPVVSRCLEKDPEHRYDNMAQLITDLDRVSKGVGLSVDAACRHCGHINASQNPPEVCEECKKSISAVFRDCPGCGARNRVDLELCRVCGFDLCTHFLRKLQRQQLARLKEEDPAAAIELLESMIGQDGTGEDEERNLTKQLRKTQREITPWLTASLEAASRGSMKEAVDLWRKVLATVPRHRIVVAEMKKAHDSALAEAQEAAEMRRLDAAIDGAKRALEFRPDSESARRLCQEVQESKNRATVLVESARAMIQAALFDRAEALITEAHTTWPDCGEIEAVQKAIPETKSEYDRHLSVAQQAYRLHDLDPAQTAAKAACESCPRSEDATALLETTRQDRSMAEACFRHAVEARRASEFQDARRELAAVDNFWHTPDRIDKLRATIDVAEQHYPDAMAAAKRAFDAANLDVAAEQCRKAQSHCPDSVELHELQRSIDAKLSGIHDEQSKRRHAIRMTAKWGGISIGALAVLAGTVYGIVLAWNWFVAHQSTYHQLAVGTCISLTAISTVARGIRDTSNWTEHGFTGVFFGPLLTVGVTVGVTAFVMNLVMKGGWDVGLSVGLSLGVLFCAYSAYEGFTEY